MTSITYIGMDVHTTNFTLCCYSFEDDKVYATVQVKPEYTLILKYMNRIRKQRGEDTRFVCGYEAGCLGYSLYHQLTDHGVEFVILAPSTMAEAPSKKIKTDKRDVEKIARCLAYHQYKPVYVPDEEDDAVKEYIRMRDDGKAHLKETKQQIIAYYTRHGFQFDGSSYWTQKHLNWVEKLQFQNSIHQEVLREYLTVLYDLSEKVAVYDARIEELSHSERYAENVGKLCCFSGIAAHTALSLLAEVGDFSRFRSAPQFAAYLGLVPGEHSSSDKQHRTGITKAGNSHLRSISFAVMRADHPLSALPSIPLYAFQGETFLLLDRNTAIDQVCISLLEDTGILPKVNYQGYRPENLISLASAGVGISLMMRNHAEFFKTEQVVIRSITPTKKSKICMIWKKGAGLSPAAQAFIQYVSQVYSSKG